MSEPVKIERKKERVVSAGSLRPGAFRPNFRVSRFGLVWWVVSAVSRFVRGSFRPMSGGGGGGGGGLYLRRLGPSIYC